MTILWADGFDDWAAPAGSSSLVAGEYENYYLSTSASSLVGGVNGRRGGGALGINSYSDFLHKSLPSSYTELFASVAIKPLNLTGQNSCIFTFTSGGTSLVSLRINVDDGSLTVGRGEETGTVLGTTSGYSLPINTYTHVQMRVVFSATTGGVVQVRINGSSDYVLNLSGLNTGGVSASAVRLGINTWGTTYFDDLVINDTSGSVGNGWLGDVRVDSYLPNANGDLSQMVGADSDSTDNYLQVNAAVPNPAKYVQSATVGAQDLYQLADMTHTPATIHGVIATAAAKKDDAGPRAIRLHAKSGGVDVASPADFALPTARARITTNFAVDPATGLPWTKAALNAAQFGLAVSV